MIGGSKVTVIWTSSPEAGPSPWVTLRGALLIPSTTVFCTEKLELSRLELKASVPRLPSRVAEATSTSPGEFTRVGTLPDGGLTESFGKTRYTSISTLVMLDR